MEVKLYVWKSEHGYWFMIVHDLHNRLIHMQPLGSEAIATRLRNHGIPLFVPAPPKPYVVAG